MRRNLKRRGPGDLGSGQFSLKWLFWLVAVVGVVTALVSTRVRTLQFQRAVVAAFTAEERVTIPCHLIMCGPPTFDWYTILRKLLTAPDAAAAEVIGIDCRAEDLTPQKIEAMAHLPNLGEVTIRSPQYRADIDRRLRPHVPLGVNIYYRPVGQIEP